MKHQLFSNTVTKNYVSSFNLNAGSLDFCLGMNEDPFPSPDLYSSCSNHEDHVLSLSSSITSPIPQFDGNDLLPSPPLLIWFKEP